MLENMSSLTKGDFRKADLYRELFAIENKIDRSEKKYALLEAAKRVKMKAVAEDMIRVMQQEESKKERENAALRPQSSVERITNFTPDKNSKSYPQMYCGSWIAADNGIMSQESSQMEKVVCYHPIMPVRRLRNLETGEEQIVLAYKRDGYWKEITVPKVETATARAITELSRYGIAVTSENAKLLVRYLSDVEMFNADAIDVQNSTGKLGWHGGTFVPYDQKIVFDGEGLFRELFQSVTTEGEYSRWVALMKELRASGSIEPRIALAASFASALVKRLGALPFIVDFYGQTEGGKTVTINVAASVWGDPAPGRFVGNFRSTDTALETRADMLNNLPMILDDSKNASKYVIDNYETLIYNLCAGKGKARSNKKLGAAKENTWSNVIICNGETPIAEHAESGGAFNRIIEVDCSERIYADPVHVNETVTKNYGFAGQVFVEMVKKESGNVLRKRQSDIEKEFDQGKFAQKQIMAASILILADELATEYIFRDGRALTVADLSEIVSSKAIVFEGQRCYEFIADAVNVYARHFDPENKNVDQWGPPPEVDSDGYTYVYFYIGPFVSLLEQNGFSRKAFSSWALKRGLIRHGKGQVDTISKNVGGNKRQKCFAIRLPKVEQDDIEEGPEGGFHQLSMTDDIPFD